MGDLTIGCQRNNHPDELGCAYLLGEDGMHRNCGQPQQLGSPYCPQHHTLCHVPSGTTREAAQLREVEALANAVGGRRSRGAGEPSRGFLKRLEHMARDFSSPTRS